ncbi:MAG: hypothetical protein KDK41_00590 [Leptospiraceae bacterium]|nr:hypothetical protein [Leptospiraceae bacterium]MCB1199110.1 hypothetical protein [Leptospiraceae bacterium]
MIFNWRKTTAILIIPLVWVIYCRAKEPQQRTDLSTPLVVLDPGHGGRDVMPNSVYGDKYDVTSHRYLDHFREGANKKGIWENEAMYEISSRVSEILSFTLDASKHDEFKRIISQFGKIDGNVKPIRSALSRENSYFTQYEKIKDDINAPYRLYDYPDIKTGEIRKGTISRINDMSPDLVVTVHLTNAGSPKYGGLASVVTPSFTTYNLAREYISASKSRRRSIRRNFLNGPYKLWFLSAYGYDRFQSFLCDSWIYFTGNWSRPDGLSLKDDKFRGYRHQLVSWSYSEEPGWEKLARTNPKGTAFASHLRDFRPIGKFWEREQDQPEQWRREGGREGSGGDNFYASQEILRFIRKGFHVTANTSQEKLPKLMPPYLSTWAVPTYVNAVAAYLEIAHLNSSPDYERMKDERETYAISIAAGIYSLFYSLQDTEKKGFTDFPAGQKLDLERYKNYKGKNYFLESKSLLPGN